MGHGRFYVTTDDWRGVGNTDSCLVIYDLHRGKSAAFRLEDFLSADTRSALGRFPFLPGVTWRGAGFVVDDANLTYYPTKLKDCREEKLPFVVVDLRSMTVEHRPAPEKLPETVIENGDYQHGMKWHWSSGNQPEPDWNTKSLLPLLLRAEILPDKVKPGVSSYLDFEKSATFQLDAASGDYVRCDDALWVPRPGKEDGTKNEPAPDASKTDKTPPDGKATGGKQD